MEIGVGYLTVLPIGRYYDFNQLGFSLCAILILYAIFRNNLMDAESMAKEYIVDELSYKKHRNLCGRIRRLSISSCKTLKESL